MVTRMVSWHWALYRAFFRVPWRALVPEPPSHDPQLSNLYLQSAGRRVPRVRAGRLWPRSTGPPGRRRGCAPFPALRLRPTSPPNSFFQLHGTRHRMRCVWAPQAPSRKPAPQSLLLGVQGPQVHSAHSLPGPPFFTLSKMHGNRAQDPGHLEIHSGAPSWGPGLGTQAAKPRGCRLACPCPALLQSPRPHITFLLGHRGGERQQGEEGQEEEASVLHPGGEHGSAPPARPLPHRGATCTDLPPAFPFSRPRGSGRSAGGGRT